MPTKIPNFLNNAQTPLGQAFANLSTALMNQPSDAEQAMTGLQLRGAQQTYQDNASKSAGRSRLGELMSNPELYRGNMEGSPAVLDGKDPALSTVGVSPVNPEFAPKPIDWGGIVKAGVQSGMDPDKVGGFLRFGDANALGARDDKTTNATVGAGNAYGSTAESFDINQANDMTKAENTNATSRANNQANIKKDIQVEGMKEKNANGQAEAEAGNWTPAAIDYAAEIYRRTGTLPAVGMSKNGAAVRGSIVNRAANMDSADGKAPGDTVAGFAEYKGNVAGEQTLGRRGANAGMAVNELTNLIPVAKDIYSNVARTGFVPADTLLNAFQNGTNDPDLAKAAVAVNDVVNAHARAINPNGEVTDAGRAQGYKLLSTAKDQVAFNAALDQMMVGAQAALKSPKQTKDQMHTDYGGTSVPASQAPAAEEHWQRGPDGKLQRVK